MPYGRPLPVHSDGPDRFALNCGFVLILARPARGEGMVPVLAAQHFPRPGEARLAAIPGSYRPLGLPGFGVAAAAAGHAAWRKRGFRPSAGPPDATPLKAKLSRNGHPVIESAP